MDSGGGKQVTTNERSMIHGKNWQKGDHLKRCIAVIGLYNLPYILTSQMMPLNCMKFFRIWPFRPLKTTPAHCKHALTRRLSITFFCKIPFLCHCYHGVKIPTGQSESRACSNSIYICGARNGLNLL